MYTFFKRPVPMWVALALGAGLLCVTAYATWQSYYFETLASIIRVSEEGELVKPMQSFMRAPALCRAHWSYWPRVIYHQSTDVCP